MKRDIVIKLMLPRTPKKRWLLLCAALVVGSGAAVYATVPNTFNAGDLLSAQKLNDNFNALVDLTSNQSVSGAKTFQSVVVNGSLGGWSSSNYGSEIVVGASVVNSNFPTIGILDQNNKNPWAITNAIGELRFSQMPSLGDSTSANTGRMSLLPNGNVLIGGNVGIGTATPAYALDVNGTIRGTNVSPSDARLKTNVRAIEHALDAVERLRGVRFDWKKDGKPSIGVIAQDVEKVYPELVSTAPDGMKSVDYGKLAGVFIEATKALRARNAALESRLDRLEAKLARQAAR
jgi:hypothetical protein